jgi:hypothetical protein
LLRENAFCIFVAAIASAAMAWLGLYGFGWNDYDSEARPAYDALVDGHFVEFLRLAPAYGGALIERAPFALLPSIWGGGELSVYRMVALPCLLAAAVLGVWLVSWMREHGSPSLARAVALGVCVANPLTLRALELGHPEELLGACLCVAAVLLAVRDRPLAAAILLGLAIANKEWALLATGPVLLCLPAKHRLRCVALAGTIAAAILAPLALISSGGFVAGTRGIATPSATIFQPWQIWWFLGHHGALVHGLLGAPKVGYRIAPPWVSVVSHPFILAVGLAMTVVLWLQGRRGSGSAGLPLSARDGLLSLALLLLLRCLLDTWDVVYYLLPFNLALLAWEVRKSPERPPVLALSSAVLAWISFLWLPNHISADGQAAFFLAWSLPLTGLLAVRLYAPTGRLVERYELLGQTREPFVPVIADHH